MPTDLPVDRLGPYPILQFAAAVMVVCALAFAIWRGTRDRRPASPPVPPEQRVFLDGPIGAILGLLRDIREASRRAELHVEPLGEELRNQTRELREIRNQIDDLRNLKRRR
jgi:hypothetical protein